MSGRRRKGHHEEHHVDERWLVSYADMITVLMALFIVLYAMSTVDQKKFDELKNSLATGFGVTKTTDKVDENKGVVPKEFVSKNGAGFSSATIALQQVAKEIQNELASVGLAGDVKVTAGTNAITISLVGSSTYFEGNDATLQPHALEVLQKLSPTLKKHAGQVTVEGHADPRGSAGKWETDWNLASARANSVLTWLLEHESVDPADISSISFGSENAKKGTSAAAIEHNRRVDIVLHSVSIPAVATDTASASESSSSGHGSSESSSSSHGSSESSSSSHGSSSGSSSDSHGSASTESESSSHH